MCLGRGSSVVVEEELHRGTEGQGTAVGGVEKGGEVEVEETTKEN